MQVFLSLVFNLLPLYLLIGVGWFAGRFLHVDRQSLGALAIYILMPVTVFGFVAHLEFQPSFIVLPIVIFTISAIVGLSFLKLGKKIYGDAQANLMAMCASMGNTGYFGLPLVLLFFTQEQVAIYIFMMLGGSVYEATIGYYMAARGAFDVRTSLRKIIRFPAIYAIAAGMSANALHLDLPETFWTYWAYFKGAYVVIGMMIIGAALSKVQKLVFGPRFVTLTFSGKFIAFPLLSIAFVVCDNHITHWFNENIHNLLIMMSIVPPAANVAAFAAQMNLEPEKAATTILAGTLFALLYIPLITWAIGLS
ncbi:MAG: AEC family transporter [Alphaproteobacteria bacterium]|nr:AEC family transporter [Alphaproteobacteria bacterium]